MADQKTKSINASEPSAGRMLGRIVKRYPVKISITSGLVIAENALELLYPLAAGVAIDAVISGDLSRAMLMVSVIFGFWLVSAIREVIDSRVYSKIYADLAADVIQTQRLGNIAASTTLVHTSLARQFVDFFEIQMPILATAFVSIVGSVVMLLLLQPETGFVAFGLLLVSIFFATRYIRVSEFIAECLHERQESEPYTVLSGTKLRITRHFRVLAGRRIQLSDMEASAYLFIGFVVATLFASLFWILSGKDGVTGGQMYVLLSYIWTFALSLDDMPVHLQSVSKIRDLGRRIDMGGEAK